MEQIEVKFETITPIWTGDAWGKNSEIRPSSIMGSLRFWFEVYCNIEDKEKIKKLKNEISKEWDEINKKMPKDKKIDIPKNLVDLIFGTTGWKSRIEIEKIEYLDDYCFGNKLNLPKKIIKDKNWFFAIPYFWGKFAITFKTTEDIKEKILFPLLKFIEDYGFLGGKSNIGYGRVKILDLEMNAFNAFKNISHIIKESNLSKNDNIFKILLEIFEIDKFYCGKEKEFESKIKNAPNKIIKITFDDDFKKNNLKELIKELIIKKSQMRNCLKHICERELKNCYENKKFKKDKNLECKNKNYKCGEIQKSIKRWTKIRHRIFGEMGEGTKIMPFIIKDGDRYKGGFISLIGIDMIGVKNEL